MSEKLLPCPFCGGDARTFEYDGANQATCGGKHIDCAGTDVVAPVAMWNRRTPAPEGDALLCRLCSMGLKECDCISEPLYASPAVPAPEGEACPHDAYETDAAGQPVRCVDCGRAIASAASPVVPVGVSEEQRQRVAEIVEAAIERHAPANSIRHTLDDADAIIAALRPTDTRWRDIATAPINERILVWVTGKMMPGARFGSAYRGANGKVIAKPEGGNGDWTKEITHWMPLPPAPTDTGRE